MSESPLMAAYLRERAARLEAERERDLARQNARRFAARLVAIYTNLGTQRCIVGGSALELDDLHPETTLRVLREAIRGIPQEVWQVHQRAPEVPAPRWHPTLPLELDTQVTPYFPATEPAPLRRTT